jgi:hypothetical protein
MKRSRRGNYTPNIHKNILEEELRILRKNYIKLSREYSKIMESDKTYQKTKELENLSKKLKNLENIMKNRVKEISKA